MIESKEILHARGIEIDLSRPNGNVFYLINNVKVLGRMKDMSKEEKQEIRDDMMSGDYQHAINVFDKAFGDIVTLYR